MRRESRRCCTARLDRVPEEASCSVEARRTSIPRERLRDLGGGQARGISAGRSDQILFLKLSSKLKIISSKE